MSVTFPPGVAGVTTTAGTGPFTITGPLAVPGGGGNYRPWSGLANGSRVHCLRGDTGLANFERGRADVANVGGVVTLTWNARLETSAGGAAPISWPGGGTQNVWIVPEPFSPENAMAEWAPYVAACRATLGLPTTGDSGAVAGAILQLITGAKIPTGVDGRNLLNLPGSAGVAGIAIAGGTATSRILRLVSSGTYGVASQADTGAGDPAWRLQHLRAYGSDGVLYPPGSFVPFAGAVYNSRYFLGLTGQLTTTRPTPDGTHAQLEIGVGVATDWLDFTPCIVIANTTGGQVAASIENGILRVL